MSHAHVHVHAHVQGVTCTIIIMQCVTSVGYIAIITEEYLFTVCKGHYKEYFNIQYPSQKKFPNFVFFLTLNYMYMIVTLWYNEESLVATPKQQIYA